MVESIEVRTVEDLERALDRRRMLDWIATRPAPADGNSPEYVGERCDNYHCPIAIYLKETVRGVERAEAGIEYVEVRVPLADAPRSAPGDLPYPGEFITIGTHTPLWAYRFMRTLDGNRFAASGGVYKGEVLFILTEMP